MTFDRDDSSAGSTVAKGFVTWSIFMKLLKGVAVRNNMTART